MVHFVRGAFLDCNRQNRARGIHNESNTSAEKLQLLISLPLSPETQSVKNNRISQQFITKRQVKEADIEDALRDEALN